MVISYIMLAKFKREREETQNGPYFTDLFCKDNCASNFSFDFYFKGKDNENNENIF